MFPARIFLVFGWLLASSPVAFAEVRFSQPTVNLGELRGGPVYSHRFEFVNDSPTPMEILDIRLGCGCLRPVLAKRVFQPGEKGSLLMHLRTLGQPNGPRTWQAHVQYRQGEKVCYAQLLLGATIRNEVTVEPSIIAMSVETTLRQEIIITDHRQTPLKIAAVLASSPAVRISTQTQGPVTKVTLEVNGAALTSARQEETLNIYTDDPAYRELQVPLTLVKASRPQVSAVPARIEFHSPTGSKLVRLRASGDRKVVVQRVETTHPALKCTWAAGPGDDATMKISLAVQSMAEAPTQADVRISLSQPVEMTMTIPVVIHKE